VLVVTPSDPGKWERARNELKRLRRSEDLFNCELVQVGSFEDGVLGALATTLAQAIKNFRPEPDIHLLTDRAVEKLAGSDDRNCHKSHHYGFVLAGAQPYYVEAFPVTSALVLILGYIAMVFS
jgi:hypothetical protein